MIITIEHKDTVATAEFPAEDIHQTLEVIRSLLQFYYHPNLVAEYMPTSDTILSWIKDAVETEEAQ